MSFLSAIGIAGSGLTAQRMRMDVTAENLANAQSTRTANGGPYRRQEVVLQPIAGSFGSALEGAMGQPPQPQGALEGAAASSGGPPGGVEVGAIVNNKTPDKLVYNPSSPTANAQGYVKMPNVDTVTEMTDLISESHAYQSDVTAMQTAKTMFNETLSILQ